MEKYAQHAKYQLRETDGTAIANDEIIHTHDINQYFDFFFHLLLISFYFFRGVGITLFLAALSNTSVSELSPTIVHNSENEKITRFQNNKI